MCIDAGMFAYVCLCLVLCCCYVVVMLLLCYVVLCVMLLCYILCRVLMLWCSCGTSSEVDLGLKTLVQKHKTSQITDGGSSITDHGSHG